MPKSRTNRLCPKLEPAALVPEDDEYGKPDLEDAWRRLPALGTINNLPIYWVGPLIEAGHDMCLSDMSSAAYTYLGEQWRDGIPDNDVPFLVDEKSISDEWARGLTSAAKYLVREGWYAGPESRADRWLAWLCFELSQPHTSIGAHAEKLGAACGSTKSRLSARLMSEEIGDGAFILSFSLFHERQSQRCDFATRRETRGTRHQRCRHQPLWKASFALLAPTCFDNRPNGSRGDRGRPRTTPQDPRASPLPQPILKSGALGEE